MYGLNYTNSNYSVGVADKIFAVGMNSSLSSHGYADVNKTLTLPNMTIFVSEDGDMIFFATTYPLVMQAPLIAAVVPTITLELPAAATAVNLTPAVNASLKSHSNSLMLSFLSNSIYRMNVTDGYTYYMSNYPSSLTNNGKTIVFSIPQAFVPNSFGPAVPLVVATTPSGSVKYSLEKQMSNASLSTNPLTYNQTTGTVTGTYLSLEFNSNTGVIQNYTNKQTGTVVFSSIYSYGNGSIGEGFMSPMFPETAPIILGSVFFYANSTSVYQFHNNLATLGSFFLSNGTTVFKVSSNLNVTVFHPEMNGNQLKFNFGNSYSNFTNLETGNRYVIDAAPTIVTITNHTFRGELFVHDGAVTVTGNTITVLTDGFAYAQFVSSNLFLNASYNLRNALQYAIDNGKLGAALSIGPGDGNGLNLTSYYNSSLQLTVQNAYANKVQVQLTSLVHNGANVAIFIPNSVIMNTSRFSISLDSQTMVELKDMNGVLNSTSQNQSEYFIAPAFGGSLVIVHISNFSAHVLEVTGSTQSPGTSTYLLVAIISAVVLVIIVGASLIFRRSGKNQ